MGVEREKKSEIKRMVMELKSYERATRMADILHARNTPSVKGKYFHAMKYGKVVIVSPSSETVTDDLFMQGKPAKRDYHIYAIPNKEDRLQFEKAAGVLERGGPATHKGVAGVAMVSVFPNLANGRNAVFFRYAQSAYSTQGENALPRKIATRYAGWRIHALTEAIRLAHSINSELILNSRTASVEFMERKMPFNEKSQFYKDLKEAAERENSEIVRDEVHGEHQLRIVKKEKVQ